MGFDEGGHSFLTLFRPEVFSVLIREGSLCMLSISHFASGISLASSFSHFRYKY